MHFVIKLLLGQLPTAVEYRRKFTRKHHSVDEESTSRQATDPAVQFSAASRLGLGFGSTVVELLGRWVTDPTDSKSLAEYGEVSLDFGPNGQLAYTIHLEGKRQIMFLTYRVERNILVIDQPSEPREERIEFEITPSGKLVVLSHLVTSTYVRVSDVQSQFPIVSPN